MNEEIEHESEGEAGEDLRPEYDVSNLLQGAIRGKYAARYKAGTNVVVLDPDVADAFPTAEVVNEALRLAMRMAELQKREMVSKRQLNDE